MGRTSRGLVLVTSIALLVGGLISVPLATADEPSTWHVQAGALRGDGAIAALAFYPNKITVHSRDSVVFDNLGGEPHTVTFNPPPDPFPTFFPPRGTTTLATPDTFSNSGFLLDIPGVPLPHIFTVTVGAPGTYEYQCMLHPEMRGKINTVPRGEELPKTDEQNIRQALLRSSHDLRHGLKIAARAARAAATAADIGGVGIEVVAGDGTGRVAVFRFIGPPQPGGGGEQRGEHSGSHDDAVLSGSITIHVGQTITFVNRDRFTPHTVTFGVPPAPLSLEELLPSASPPYAYDGTKNLHSGLLMSENLLEFYHLSGIPGLGANLQFRVSFTKVGTYHFECTLHDGLGMDGTINVVP